MKFSLLLIFLFFSTSVWAKLSDQLAVEAHFQDKVRRVLELYDRDARSVVNIKLRSISTVLPGTGTSVENVSLASVADGLAAGDIESVSVEIFSRLEPFPAEGKEAVATALGLPRNVTRVLVKRTPAAAPDAQAEMQKNVLESVRSVAQAIEKNGEAMGGTGADLVKTVASFGAILAATFALTFAVFMFLMNGSLKDVLQGLRELASAGGSRADGVTETRSAPRSETAVTAPERTSAVGGDTLELPIEGLLELFADCYWSEKDGYARWVWSRIRPAVRAELLEKWPTLRDYSLAFAKVAVSAENFHEHPYYLKPLKLEAISNADLLPELRAQRGIWHLLSPLRQRALPIALSERLQLHAAGVAQGFQPRARSAPRKMGRAFEAGFVGAEDDLWILTAGDSVPEELRRKIPSLAWLLRLDESAARQLLQRWSPGDLAEIWDGPAEILEKVAGLLPEKKREAVLELSARRAPNRVSSTMDRMLAEVFAARVEVADSSGEERRAS